MNAGMRAVRHVVYDTNYWKSFIHARLAVPMGDAGCLSLFGRKPEPDRLFSEHLTAEYKVRTEGRGRTVDEWKIKPTQPDNHWFDGIVGCAVAASVQGVSLPGTESREPKPTNGFGDVSASLSTVAREPVPHSGLSPMRHRDATSPVRAPTFLRG